jgi:hypothetical protein
MRPILHGTALCPLFRFPTGARLRLKVVMDADLALDGRALVFAARPRYAVAGQRPLFRATLLDSPEAWAFTSPNTVELSLAPDAADETAESEMTLADLQTAGLVMWRLDVMDPEAEWPALRLQGDMEFMQAEGDWDDTPASTAAIPTLTVAIVDGVATVTVALMSDGASVNNAAVVAAIEEDPEAVAVALTLGTAAFQGVEAFASPNDVQNVANSAEDNRLILANYIENHVAETVGAHGMGTAGTKDAGVAGGVATLGDDGKLPAEQLPAIALTEFLGEAVNQAAMLALTGQFGDWVKRTDTGTVWIIIGSNPTQLSSWSEISYPAAPVSSVAGLTGSVGASALRGALGLATTDTPTFGGMTINGPISTGAAERTVTGNFARTGYEYFGGATIGIGNLVGVQEFAVGFNNRIRFLASSTNVFIAGGACMQPKTGGVELNDGTRGSYADYWMRDLKLNPSSSVTPAVNGELSIEATSNTSVTIKLKGSDGTVRSVSLTLS